MFCYSKKIVGFIKEIKITIKLILKNEILVTVKGDRFFDSKNEYSYPIKVMIFNNKSMLGYFDPCFYELGFHEKLMHTNKIDLYNVIRHELAHYFVFITHPFAPPHGDQFKQFCLSRGWEEEVYSATICLDDGNLDRTNEDNDILRKVQKLMALASSSNQFEAEQAMIKSQQLLIKHNIDGRYLDPSDDERFILKRILKQKKENAKMRSIAYILDTFLVTTVYNRSSDHIYLEIVGSQVNVDIAEYVANYLDHTLDMLWESSRKKHHQLKGLMAKNSFFLGIAKGYCDKIKTLRQQCQPETSKSLLSLEKKLAEAKDMIYERLRHTTSTRGYCATSSLLGESIGRALNIHTAVENSTHSSLKLLT